MRFFDPAMQALVNARAKRESDLRKGILRGQSEKTPARIDEMRAGRQPGGYRHQTDGSASVVSVFVGRFWDRVFITVLPENMTVGPTQD